MKFNLPNKNLSKQDFETFYINEDPWNVKNSIVDILRVKVLNDYFKNKIFNSGIDMACGEGVLLKQMDFIKNKVGIDISRTAIERGKKNYPEIKFLLETLLKS